MSSAVLWPAAQSQNTANNQCAIEVLSFILFRPHWPCYLKQPHHSTDRNTITQTRAYSGYNTIRHMHWEIFYLKYNLLRSPLFKKTLSRFMKMTNYQPAGGIRDYIKFRCQNIHWVLSEALIVSVSMWCNCIFQCDRKPGVERFMATWQ